MKRYTRRPPQGTLLGTSSGSFVQQIISEEARFLGIYQLNQGLRLDLCRHLIDVIHITIRSELIRWKESRR